MRLQERREFTREKFARLRDRLSDIEPLLGDRACIYATGSYGRLEAGEQSDLDLFILARADENGVPGSTT